MNVLCRGTVSCEYNRVLQIINIMVKNVIFFMSEKLSDKSFLEKHASGNHNPRGNYHRQTAGKVHFSSLFGLVRN